MKNTAFQDNILYNLLNDSALKTAITGKIYKGQRPLGSKLEDVVIQSMPISDGTLQQGVANVNIYIPMLYQNILSQKQVYRNTARIEQILNIATPILKESFGENYSMWTSKQGDYPEEELEQTRLNYRIEFRIDDTI